MRKLLVVPALLFFASLSFASELTVAISDPHHAPVAGARITLLRGDSTSAAAVQVTSAKGEAVFTGLNDGPYRVEVMAAGFAPCRVTASVLGTSRVSASLKLASRPETVQVTATATPLPQEETGMATETVSASTLELLQPVSALEPLRFLPGATTSSSGRRGSLSSLFVRGGDSRYNKVIIDGVPVNDPGGVFDFGVVPLTQVDRMEFVRGAASSLYGSDAMTSVVQIFTRTGTTPVPELRFGAEGGTFSSARGHASLAGAYRRLDYNIFAEQFNTQGQGVNDAYGNSSQGGNVGVQLSHRAEFRVRVRHSNSRTGVQSFWNFNGRPLLPPDSDQFARQNNLLGSAELTLAAPSRWMHHLSVFAYNHRRLNSDQVADRGCGPPLFLDCAFLDRFNMNRAGVSYRGDFSPVSWARTSFGYYFEDENGFIDQDFSGFTDHSHGLRRNHEVYGEQWITWKRLSLLAGARLVHNESFGNRGVPRLSASLLAVRGGSIFSGTRLHFGYSEGIKAPRLEESFGLVSAFGFVTDPNPQLKPEENRSWEAGAQQEFFGRRASLAATYFHNLFRNQIEFSFDPATFTSSYVNLNRSLAHGAEVELHLRPAQRISLDASYTYDSTQILSAPIAFDPLLIAGRPLLRRPLHSGSARLQYYGSRWGSILSAEFVGRRPDSDFLGLTSPPIDHSAGYARVDLGGWYMVRPRITAYANIENALDRHYEEAAGYPALKANFRAGLRFRVGGD